MVVRIENGNGLFSNQGKIGLILSLFSLLNLLMVRTPYRYTINKRPRILRLFMLLMLIMSVGFSPTSSNRGLLALTVSLILITFVLMTTTRQNKSIAPLFLLVSIALYTGLVNAITHKRVHFADKIEVLDPPKTKDYYQPRIEPILVQNIPTEVPDEQPLMTPLTPEVPVKREPLPFNRNYYGEETYEPKAVVVEPSESNLSNIIIVNTTKPPMPFDTETKQVSVNFDEIPYEEDKITSQVSLPAQVPLLPFDDAKKTPVSNSSLEADRRIEPPISIPMKIDEKDVPNFSTDTAEYPFMKEVNNERIDESKKYENISQTSSETKSTSPPPPFEKM